MTTIRMDTHGFMDKFRGAILRANYTYDAIFNLSQLNVDNLMQFINISKEPSSKIKLEILLRN